MSLLQFDVDVTVRGRVEARSTKDGVVGWEGGEWWPELSRRGGSRSAGHRLWTLETCAQQVEALVEQAFALRRRRAAGAGELEAGDDRRDGRCSQQVWIDVGRGIGARSGCDDRR